MSFGRVVDLGASSLRDAVDKLIEYAVHMDDEDSLATAREFISVMDETVSELRERIDLAERRFVTDDGFTP
jgi:hypothetical protein